MRRESSNRVRRYRGRPPPFGGRPFPTFLASESAPLLGLEHSLDPNAISSEAREVPEASAATRGCRLILVPLDGTPFGEHALPLALGIARRSGGIVKLVHVHCPLDSAYRPESLYYNASYDVFKEREARDYLRQVCRRLARVTTVPVVPAFMQGREVASALLEKANNQMDLVVMATHARGPVGRLWRGSVTHALLRQLDVPLVLVRGHSSPVDLTGDPLLRHIAVALDGTRDAERILPTALKLGALASATRTLLHVVRGEEQSLRAARGMIPGTPAQVRRIESARAYLDNVVGRLGKDASRVTPRIVLDAGSTAQAILRHAQDADVDLIAMTMKNRGWLARLFQGSVTDQVIRAATVPVMICRADREKMNTEG